MLPPGCHLLIADGAFSTRAIRTGQLHTAKKHRIQFGHCRLTMLFPIAQLIKIALPGIPFASRMVVFFDERAGEITANPLCGPMNTITQLKVKRRDCRIPGHSRYNVVSDCSAVAESRCQTLRRGRHHRPRADSQARQSSIARSNQPKYPENSMSTLQQFNGTESINSEE